MITISIAFLSASKNNRLYAELQHNTHMLSGFVCVRVTFPVTMVTKATARSGGVWTHSLQFFTMRRSHVCLQTADVDENNTHEICPGTRVQQRRQQTVMAVGLLSCQRWFGILQRSSLSHGMLWQVSETTIQRPALYGRHINNVLIYFCRQMG